MVYLQLWNMGSMTILDLSTLLFKSIQRKTEKHSSVVKYNCNFKITVLYLNIFFNNSIMVNSHF